LALYLHPYEAASASAPSCLPPLQYYIHKLCTTTVFAGVHVASQKNSTSSCLSYLCLPPPLPSLSYLGGQEADYALPHAAGAHFTASSRLLPCSASSFPAQLQGARPTCHTAGTAAATLGYLEDARIATMGRRCAWQPWARGPSTFLGLHTKAPYYYLHASLGICTWALPAKTLQHTCLHLWDRRAHVMLSSQQLNVLAYY